MGVYNPPIIPPPPDDKKDLLGASALCTAEIAMSVISNRFSSQLNWWGLFLICGIPLILTVIWLYKREQEQGKLRRLWKGHPVSYSIIALVAVVFFWTTGSLLIAKLRAPSKPEIATRSSDLTAKPVVPATVAKQGPQPPATAKPIRPKVSIAPTLKLPAARDPKADAPTGTPEPQDPRPTPPTYQQQCVDCAQAQGPGASATLNKYGATGPAPNPIVLKVRDVNPARPDTGSVEDSPERFNPGSVVFFTVDRQFDIPIFTITCDRPCVATSADINFRIPMGPRYLTTNNPYVARVILGTMGPLTTDIPVKIWVRSMDNEKVSVTKVEGYIQPVPKPEEKR
jgi:hypothetical protein